MSAGHVMFVSRCSWKHFHIHQIHQTLIKARDRADRRESQRLRKRKRKRRRKRMDRQEEEDEEETVCAVMEDVVCVDEETVQRLTEGFLSHYLPELSSSRRALQELTQNQVILLETLDQEVSKFRECNATIDLNALFTEAKVYHSKLVNIRKEMIVLHDKTSRLKKRALKLQQHKQKEDLEREQQRERELERERRLIAKPAKRSDPEPH
ncbi:biogenesis of lysosome-related organelles complex 1 subunit 6 isoform X2 [Puntigrus tetrazona]|uniref:biogenesis of lysosome-related organelles complex 1 subunit 6 isoform X2 n=1 Tax=Puntigrus tetrazona TaxID=1606681 RepID=UPI001C897608|nr:biogenesis of lysosome-related organelles complex 1 subunit 6 isoform X2 [Puntigrus tetrazona]